MNVNGLLFVNASRRTLQTTHRNRRVLCKTVSIEYMRNEQRREAATRPICGIKRYQTFSHGDMTKRQLLLCRLLSLIGCFPDL